MASLDIDYSVATTVRRFEGKFAVLETSDAQSVRWPIKNLPDDVQEGATLRLLITSAKTDEESREKLARTVINSLLA
ncbi:MAG: DUF3006 domain-containing protein [Patescibacteria group bacterium]|jgi:hypothetical protein